MTTAKGHGTAIGWTHAEGFKGETWNVCQGCEKVSPACGLALPGEEDQPHGTCYACGIAHRGLQPVHVGLTIKRDGEPIDWTGEIRLQPERLDVPLGWKKPRMIFCGSMTDICHRDVPEEFIARMFTTMRRADQHIYQLLTKRPQRMAALMNRLAWRTSMPGERGYQAYFTETPEEAAGSFMPPWWWVGTSIETDRYVWRANHLRATPAAVRFLSCEPLLTPLPSLDLTGVTWLLIGGESGPGARRMDPEWALDLIERCAAEGVACYMKQAGSVLAKEWGMSDRSGTNADEMPEPFRVRQWPVTEIPEGQMFA